MRDLIIVQPHIYANALCWLGDIWSGRDPASIAAVIRTARERAADLAGRS